MGVKLGLQTQNFCAVGRGGFVRLVQLGREGLDLVLARGELCGLCGELLGRVRECVVFVLEISVVLLEGIQRRAQGTDVLVYFYLVGTSPKCKYRKWRFASHLFFLALLRQALFFLPFLLFTFSKPAAVGFETLDRRVALAETRFEL